MCKYISRGKTGAVRLLNLIARNGAHRLHGVHKRDGSTEYIKGGDTPPTLNF